MYREIRNRVKQSENLKKKSKVVNICRFSTIPVKICEKQKFQTLNIVLAINIININNKCMDKLWKTFLTVKLLLQA